MEATNTTTPKETSTSLIESFSVRAEKLIALKKVNAFPRDTFLLVSKSEIGFDFLRKAAKGLMLFGNALDGIRVSHEMALRIAQQWNSQDAVTADKNLAVEPMYWEDAFDSEIDRCKAMINTLEGCK